LHNSQNCIRGPTKVEGSVSAYLYIWRGRPWGW
jgi:hypothetical protein